MLLANLLVSYDKAINKLHQADGLPLLLLRVYLAPVFIQAGWHKFKHFEDTVYWFGDAEWGLGMPLPEVMATLAASAEFIGGWMLLFGVLTRLVSVPLMVTMLVAALTVHIEHGWLAIADSTSWLADGTIFYNEAVMAAAEKKQMADNILREYGNYEWLTSSGSFTVLNNGVEFAVTYFIMCLVLFFYGGGRYVSVDFYLNRSRNKSLEPGMTNLKK